MYSEILILAIIRDQPRHGYDIKKRVGAVLGLGVSLNNNTLYPSLRRFEQEGAVKSKLESPEGTPARRVYRLTPKGHELLRSMIEDFPPEQADSDPEFLVRLAFFDLVDEEAQLDILATRRRALESELEHVSGIRTSLDPKRDRYPVTLVDFLIGRIREEIEWIGGLQRIVKKEARR